MKKWVVTAKKADFDAIGRQFNISPILARIIRNRDIVSGEDIAKFINGTMDDSNDPYGLKDIELGVELTISMIRSGGKIRIIGDYDVDGVCATYILYRTISIFTEQISYQLPDRIHDGYGLNRSIIDKANADEVALIITCDNGIAAVDEIAYAKKLGMCVVVTDHHEPSKVLPAADALIDPKQPGCTYPYKDICGAVVAYKFCSILCEKIGVELPGDLLQFAAFATECDVMPLLDENRIIVKYGIEAMKNTENIGLRALIDATGINRASLTPYHLGFILGPCVNATGRLDLAARALELFLTDDVRHAAIIASELKNLNESRKEMTVSCTKEAIDIVVNGDDNNPAMTDDTVLVIYLPNCHESIAGIVAGKVRECYYKPAIILTKGEDNAKGSGRSIEGYNMFEALSSVSDIFIKFGGHKMAAGMSLETDRIGELRKRLNSEANLSEEDLTEKIRIDIPMPMRYATETLVEELNLLSPHGVGNPKPLFAQKGLVIKDIRVQGKLSNVVKLSFEEEDIQGIYFTDGNEFVNQYEIGTSVSIVYTPEINEYMGKRYIQASIKEIRPDT